MSMRVPIVRCAAASVLALSSGCHASPSPTEMPAPVVINDNGAWCWYQDPRVVVDETNGTLLVGSVAGPEGPGGAVRSGNIELVAYNVRKRRGKRVVIDNIVVDDHDAPALYVRRDGRYLVMYSNHNIDYLSRYRISSAPHEARSFGPKQVFDWRTVDSDFHTTYNNLYELSAEGMLYDFSRADNRSPNILTSADEGSTWKYAGRLTESSTNVGYVNGYFKYASNGVDRIDFVGTEHHPYDYDTSIYHGIVKGGMTFQSDGVTVADPDVFDDEAPEPSDFTPVFRTGFGARRRGADPRVAAGPRARRRRQPPRALRGPRPRRARRHQLLRPPLRLRPLGRPGVGGARARQGGRAAARDPGGLHGARRVQPPRSRTRSTSRRRSIRGTASRRRSTRSTPARRATEARRGRGGRSRRGRRSTTSGPSRRCGGARTPPCSGCGGR